MPQGRAVPLLSPMRAKAFAGYRQAPVAGYAQEKVAAGEWAQAGSLERSLAEFDSPQRQGLATPNNPLFEMLAGESGATVAYQWFALRERAGHREACFDDGEVIKAFHRRGRAPRARAALEGSVAATGLARIGPHVSAHNPGAHDLYRQVGCGATGIGMLRAFGGARAV